MAFRRGDPNEKGWREIEEVTESLYIGNCTSKEHLAVLTILSLSDPPVWSTSFSGPIGGTAQQRCLKDLLR